ncbi:hypothetical protein GCM10010967_15300 [Dyadobacter beijingensis]|uniref:Secreted protein (Por secretion system target) n=1 Tax=Dyadobacter beijingensis TaxID=365489 RepID=A0ABQ2HLC2_9BACT|nr:choice-of-anchor tandem repeat GloVer-containing protein [Dyadobacter beijingensis]GGM84392.1 hypothetical protein GCM10010967_15300 [Dyadobacter beijingensis]
MKKPYYSTYVFTLLLCTIASFAARSQGINQFWGVAFGGGTELLGNIFNASPDGTLPTSQFNFYIARKALAIGQFVEYNGELYATARTESGLNVEFSGNLFKWNPATDEYTLLHNFRRETGARPHEVMVLMGSKLYGITMEGGTNAQGVIFEYDLTTNTYAKRADFASLANDRELWPSTALSQMNGKLYGIARTNFGELDDALYEWDPATAQFTQVRDVFGPYQPGLHAPDTPWEGLNGKLYATTKLAGTSFGDLVEWDPEAGTYVSKAAFSREAGYNCLTKMTPKDGKLYGATTAGGAESSGTLFEFTPEAGTITKKIDLAAGANAPFNGFAPVLLGDKFYGVTQGGKTMRGRVYEWNPATNTFSLRFGLPDYTNGLLSGAFTPWQGKLYSAIGRPQPNNGRIVAEVFNWDPATNQYTTGFISQESVGAHPRGGVTLAGGKFYGATTYGGKLNMGVIFEFDPKTKAYKILKELDETTGQEPYGKLTLLNGKLYGITSTGGRVGFGAIFEVDYQNSTVTKKRDFEVATGRTSYGSLIAKDGKLFGMTMAGGNNNRGTIFEWDPVTNSFTVRYHFDKANGGSPRADLCLKDGLFYGMTYNGGTSDVGVIFRWDPATDTYTKIRDLRAGVGVNPVGSFVEYNEKLYGLTPNSLLELDPATLKSGVLATFDGTAGGKITVGNEKFYFLTTSYSGTLYEWNTKTKVLKKSPGYGNGTDFTLSGMTFEPLPAPVSDGTPGNCLPLPPATVDGNNWTEWLPVIDASKNAVAEIRANKNNLGTVTPSLFTHTGNIRKVNGRYFLGRDLTLTTSGAIASGTPVDVRIYVKQEEYDALVAANNADPKAEPITNASQIGVFATAANDCNGNISGATRAIQATSEPWAGGGYVFSFKTESFSTFYLANANAPFPVKLVDFNARLEEHNAVLSWQTAAEINFSHFELERSTDARNFGKIGRINPSESGRPGHYAFLDMHLNEVQAPNAYYRLKMIDADGTYAYSVIRQVAVPGMEAMLYPNPASDVIEVKQAPASAPWQLIGADGNAVLNGRSEGGNFRLDVRSLRPGTYLLRFSTGQDIRTFRMVKQ